MPSNPINDVPPPMEPVPPADVPAVLALAPFAFPEFEHQDPTVDPREDSQREQREGAAELALQIELGRVCLDHQVVNAFRSGSVVPLDKQAGHSMDIYVADQLVARGELLVLDGKFCVRITQRFCHEPLA